MMAFRSTALHHRLIFDAILSSRRSGLPADRAERLPEVDRIRTRNNATPWFPCDIRRHRRLSPAVLREESEGVLRDWGLRSSLQKWWSYRWVSRRSRWFDLVSIRKPRGYQFEMRLSADKRDEFPALRSTGSLPVSWTWNSPLRRTHAIDDDKPRRISMTVRISRGTQARRLIF